MTEKKRAPEALKPGVELQSWVAPPITRHTLALYCGASGDHNPIHVDIDFAHAAGMPDVFAHGMLVMAYLGQVLTRSLPAESLRSFGVRFKSITNVGAVITCYACVVDRYAHKEEDRVRLSLKAIDQFGSLKLQGEAVLAITPPRYEFDESR